MPRGPATFKQSEVMRVIKAVRAAGLDVIASTILPDGSLLLGSRAARQPDAERGTRKEFVG
jgi:hypothetical protein